FGPGLPHNDQYVLPFHITNMYAKDMSVRWGKPGDFQDWVKRNRESLQTRHPELITVFASTDSQPPQYRHYPRAVMGEYLKSQFEAGVEAARNLGMSVELYPNCEVTDLFEHDGHINLQVRGNLNTPSSFCYAEGVLLATGHWFESQETENYFPSPWPASELLIGIPAAETVGVIGSSLSAIEVALTLTSDGHFVRQPSGTLSYLPSGSPRKLVLYSRNGLLPRVRGQSGPRQNRYLTCNRIRQLIEDTPYQLTLSVIFELLDRELSAAYGYPFDWQQLRRPTGDAAQILEQDIHNAQRGDGSDGELVWQTILVQIFPVVRDLYLNLTLDERKRFDRHFTTLFFMHAATQPVINAEKLLALLQAGIVSIVKLGNDYHFERDDATGEYKFTYKDPEGNTRCDAYHYVVNARGQTRSLESDSAALTRNLLRRNVIQVEETRIVEPADYSSYKTGSILVNPETYQIIQPDRDAASVSNPPVFAVGAMTRGQMIDASMAYGIARSTAAIADLLIAKLCRNNDDWSG
ncbi:MAG: FAD/NAD(P)-binding protein, partial [Deltaproteobacteria bacterium]|nr:FAD/NAD(P)-binding protein [Deltaproteobacteria bacterium]